jgi:hypothetical protein
MQVFEKCIIARMPKVMTGSRIARSIKYTYNLSFHVATQAKSLKLFI